MKEPIWLTKSIVEAIHISQIREHGGQYGIKDINLLESAIARPMSRWAYEQEADIVILAAAYGYGLAKNPCFIDGNKRVAFMAMYTFLGLNGFEIGYRYQVEGILLFDLSDPVYHYFENLLPMLL